MKAEPIISGWNLFGLLAAVVLALSATILVIHPNLTGATLLVVRVTAYTSLVPFLAAFLASPLVALAPNGFTRRMLRERRYLGLSFAFSHVIHFAAIVGYGALNPQFWPSRSALTNTPRTIGYVFIALLAATSFHIVSKRMSPTAWKRLHTTGVWAIAIVFALSFLKRTQTISTLYFIPLAIVCIAIVVRIAGKRTQAARRSKSQVNSASRS